MRSNRIRMLIVALCSCEARDRFYDAGKQHFRCQCSKTFTRVEGFRSHIETKEARPCYRKRLLSGPSHTTNCLVLDICMRNYYLWFLYLARLALSAPTQLPPLFPICVARVGSQTRYLILLLALDICAKTRVALFSARGFSGLADCALSCYLLALLLTRACGEA
jgi:hypothetical protein